LHGKRCECKHCVHPSSLFLQDTRHEATPEVWQETYVSALLRAILYSDDATYFRDVYRKLDPIPSPEVTSSYFFLLKFAVNKIQKFPSLFSRVDTLLNVKKLQIIQTYGSRIILAVK
jgi:hypothetical protein